ncbi:hypothetical protein AC623_00815 [Bacillus sp. FJAT-27231]|uniref:hypothetical protein n=1 Tax=Bacillus sp. FJAT-27231 TaxID=1679168 RepID=UPI0006716AE3|nr:hypothetical protein [Bacillus sp. FJAT-27231]KMY52702.1 hypothetical protein AC623_00815 [Bacillus sp. FJAT-27231]
MRHLVKRGILLIFILLVTGCKEQAPSSTKLTIEPYLLTDKEEELISKTDAANTKFFKLNGTLKKGDDIQYAIALYEKGKFKQNLLLSFGELESRFQDEIISFGTSDIGTDNPSLKLLEGVPNGLNTTEFEHSMTSWSFSNFIGDKITLEKNKPIYLAGWSGTTKDSMRSLSSENGELPEGIKETEIALLYKIKWTDAREPESTEDSAE